VARGAVSPLVWTSGDTDARAPLVDGVVVRSSRMPRVVRLRECCVERATALDEGRRVLQR